MRVELVLAVVAPVRRIRAVLRTIELARVNYFVVQIELRGDVDREATVVFG